MIVLGIDLETTGLDPNKDAITEVGAILWDTETQTPLKILNSIVDIPGELDQRIIDLTGLTDEIIDEYGELLPEVLRKLQDMVNKAECLVIHNAQFDLGFLSPVMSAFGYSNLNDMPVIDTMKDLPLNKMRHSSVKLIHLATSHGFLNPFSHRAMFDVLTSLKILTNYDIDEVLKRSKAQTIVLIAQVSYDDRELAKDAGFRWDPPNKQWILEVKDCDLPDMNFDFPTERK